MRIPEEFIDVILLIIVISIAMPLVSYLTKRSRNFRSSRNKKARKQF